MKETQVEPTPEITLRQRIASLVTDYTFEDVVSALSVQAQDNARVAYTENLARQEMGGGVMTRSTSGRRLDATAEVLQATLAILKTISRLS
jgi:hypothetical protein